MVWYGAFFTLAYVQCKHLAISVCVRVGYLPGYICGNGWSGDEEARKIKSQKLIAFMGQVALGALIEGYHQRQGEKAWFCSF